MTDITELMGMLASTVTTDPAAALAEVSRHVINHETRTCSCRRPFSDPLEHLADVAENAFGLEHRQDPAPAPIPVRPSRDAWSDGPSNRVDRMLHTDRSDRDISKSLRVPIGFVRARREAARQFDPQPEEAAA